ncbi:cdc42 effector protein 5 isoform 1-T2 [Pholidichthys leucotaenia]
MPLHKSSRAPRLDPTMISAPLGDFRHTMHIGRGGDAFGDTSFLSILGPSPASPDRGSPVIMSAGDHSSLHSDAPESPQSNELQHSESVSSFTLDLDLDLGPSMLGDVLGVMDNLGFDSNEEDVFSSTSSSLLETKQGKRSNEMSVHTQKELNGNDLIGRDESHVGDSRIPDGNSVKAKGLRQKVRFSDKREEIIRHVSEEEESQDFDFQDEEQMAPPSPVKVENERGKIPVSEDENNVTNHKDLPPSPASSHSSEYEGVTPLDRRVDRYHSETDSEEDEGRGYTFEDEYGDDDEIGL